MTLAEARRTLLEGKRLYDVGIALSIVGTTPRNSTIDTLCILWGLRHPAVIAEQCAYALYSRTARPFPADRRKFDVDPTSWLKYLVSDNPKRRRPVRSARPRANGVRRRRPAKWRASVQARR